MKEIEIYIENYLGIGGQNLSAIADLFEHTEVAKNDYLLRRNQYAQSVHFVKSGYLRIYASNANDTKEITQWISNQGMFLTDLSSFLFATPSRWNIQALSDCELYTISKSNWNAIGDKVENWEELEKLFIAKCFVSLENRVFAQLSMTTEEKIHNLMQENPEIFLQVPLQYIASMLGMTPETLSRVRRKMIS